MLTTIRKYYQASCFGKLKIYYNMLYLFLVTRTKTTKILTVHLNNNKTK